MKAFIVFCHPSEDSFTSHVRGAFIKGIVDSGNEYILSDLYKMNFKADMTEKEYLRDANYRDTPDIAEDVLAEHEKINSADAIVFIYPVFWTEAPAKLVGWFDRVWSYGFAYGENRKMKMLKKGLILCSAGNPLERLEEFGLFDNMRVRVLGDISVLDEDLQQSIRELEEASASNTGLKFQVAINYGGRDEIVRATRKISELVKEGKLNPEDITEKTFSEYLDTAGMPDPELMIRTSGELRTSNFLPWQIAYSEFYFTNVLWPDFDKKELERAIDFYNGRERRFGGI